MRFIIVLIAALFVLSASKKDSVAVEVVPDSTKQDTSSIKYLLRQTEQKLDSLILNLENEKLQRN